MSLTKALLSGLVGAGVLSLLNESARQLINDAPRLDVLGKRAIALPLLKAGQTPPNDNELYWISMSGDIALNTLYYGLIALDEKENAVRNGALLGLAMGVGTVFLPKQLGLGNDTSARNEKTALMTVAWYLAGGLAAAAVYKTLSGETKN